LPFTVRVAAQSDVGCVRENNEDSFGYDTARQIYVVCDGMGGMAGGEVASNLAVRSFLSSAQPDGQTENMGSSSNHILLFDLVLAANRAVHQAAQQNAALQGMGTTLVAACVDGERVLIANVGDSRAYLLRDGGCAQLTTDHSFIEEQIRLGRMTRETAEGSPAASVITRAVGIEDSVEPDLFSLALADGDLILLTTDGLTRYVTAEELAALIRPSNPIEDTCAALINTAKMRGAVDNVTCLLLQFQSKPSLTDGASI
jgi:serine/threonine protein phosphatase PrpC